MIRRFRLLTNAVFRHPTWASAYLLRRWHAIHSALFHRKRLKELDHVVVPLEKAYQAIGAPTEAELAFLKKECAAFERTVGMFVGKGGSAGPSLAEALYVLCRLLKPERVIETGLLYGVTSAYILKALEENGKGTLHTIDLPPLDPEEAGILGTAIPQELRKRWSLSVGPSRRILPEILRKTGSVDIFLHDSEHTYINQMGEFRCVWEYLPSGGILLSDDIHRNDAFLDFALRVNRRPVVVGKSKWGYIGIIMR